ncbi:uncharacterized protein LOC135107939 [Scylla paramamosain]|uniref:uncharacterized protein LOC135107939 n=1 Tax=Scylla paramamosain TaxID=85552 RepID=UPI003083711B
MTRTLCSRSGWFLFHAALQTVLALTHERGVEGLGAARMTVDNVWTGADTITVSILPSNLSNHKILVSVQQEDNASMIVVDTLQRQSTPALNFLMPLQHQVEELMPDTRYKVCVALSEQESSQPDTLHSECYRVKTFPRVDNVKGVYGGLVAVAVFLVACGLGWLIYRAFWVKYYTQVLKVQDNQQVEQPMAGHPTSSPPKEIMPSETESTLSTVETTQ